MKTHIHRFVLAMMVLGLGACASGPQKADLPNDTDPQAKLTELRGRLDADRAKQYDQLSPENFQAAAKYLDRAQQGIAKGEKAQDVVDNEANAQARLQVAEQNGAKGESALSTVLASRKAALDAGAPKATPHDLAAADEKLSSYGKDIESNSFHPESMDVSKLEAQYSAIELNAAKRSALGNSWALIQHAKNDRDAQSKAPQTLQMAQSKYDTALRAIEANRRNPSAYQPAVDDANQSAKKLDFVLNTIGSSDTSEASAVKIWDQQQQLASTKQTLQSTQAQVDQEKAQEAATEQNLQGLQSKNDEYAQKEAAEKKIDQAKAEFTPGEADVLRDGNKIILRLKNVKFTSSSAELNQSSIATLQKVKDMIAAVPDYSKVEVQGHTDNVGSEEKNQVLSQKRADMVKNYLVEEKTVPDGKIEARGYGDEVPLTSNKTKEGRATNRRVDVVIDLQQG